MPITRTVLVMAALVAVLAVVGSPAAPPTPGPATTAPPAPATPAVKQVYDIAVNDVWVDPQTCQLWVRYTNLGTRPITKTLGYSIKVAGVEVDKGFQAFNLAPGAFWANGVGTTQNPVKVFDRKLADAHVDTGQQLPEPSTKRANNRLRKWVDGCKLVLDFPKT
ncbi:MAG: hypothetical protein HY825_04910 [Acidobacteria bacterium]|nr:hypothetical protein [Acidobacteriota bacterium]